LIIVFGGCATDDIFSRFQYRNEKIQGFTKHFAEGVFEITQNRFFSVELLIWDGKLSTGENRVYLIVHNSEDKDIEGADLTVVAKNMETGSTVKAAVLDKGDGLYRTQGLTLDKPGAWEVSVTVVKGGRSDKALFSFTTSS